jgi:hypothetical protein
MINNLKSFHVLETDNSLFGMQTSLNACNQSKISIMSSIISTFLALINTLNKYLDVLAKLKFMS